MLETDLSNAWSLENTKNTLYLKMICLHKQILIESSIIR